MDKQQLEEGLELTMQFAKRGGLVPVVTQNYKTGEILMLSYANQEALNQTLKTGYATYWSTSRNRLWTKGKESSGDFLKVVEVLVDCDQDALLYKVEPVGNGACHTKNKLEESRKSCFYRRLKDTKNLEFLKE